MVKNSKEEYEDMEKSEELCQEERINKYEHI